MQAAKSRKITSRLIDIRSAFEGAMDEAQIAKQVTPEMERTAAQKARDRARAARWDLDVAIFLFGILVVLIILLFQGIGIGVVVPVATFGLAMV